MTCFLTLVGKLIWSFWSIYKFENLKILISIEIDRLQWKCVPLSSEIFVFISYGSTWAMAGVSPGELGYYLE